jgi:hypothetical protein
LIAFGYKQDDTGVLSFSDDNGVTWNNKNTSIDYSQIIYGSNVLIGVGYDPTNKSPFFISRSNLNWNTVGISSDMFGLGNGITYAQKIGRYVAVGGQGETSIAYCDESDDMSFVGIINSSDIFTEGMGVIYGSDKFVAVGIGLYSIAYSIDGKTDWKGVDIDSNNIFTIGYSVTFNGKVFVAVGEGLYSIAYSSDGINWQGVEDNNIFTTAGYSVIWNGKVFVAVGEGKYSIAYSSDGKTDWKGVDNSNDIFTVGKSITWNGKVFVAVGEGDDYSIAYSIDGKTDWKGVPNSNDVFTVGYSVV